ncbi:MAG TPA: hypothetical protein VF571_10965 [Pyrinomonadaceae bacterium]|jgi:pyroglutamyl-peptidase
MKILLTGFNPFGELKINPSQLIVQEIKNRSKSGDYVVIPSVLKTEYDAAENKIRKLLREIRPDACVCLGLAMGGSSIQLERIALNLDDTDSPDNAGELRCDRPIIADGPDIYRSTLPLNLIHEALRNCGIPTHYSNHAGTYICNHVFYTAIHEIQRLGINAKCGFIHVPFISKDTQEPIRFSAGLPLEMMIEAIECCLDIISKDIAASTKSNDASQLNTFNIL